jgi:MinD-like ATPase involved in chromosome partitioning or flagellar assembly
MSVIALASLKGSPGVTTTACLLGATWPEPRQVVVGECDPSGGDLAARFALSSRQGWSSLAAAIRRQGVGGPLADHLQTLPGGLRVLVGGRETAVDAARLAHLFLDRAIQFGDGPWDFIADLGRLLPQGATEGKWFEVAATVVLVLRPDASSVVHVKNWADGLPSELVDRIGLVTVGSGEHPADEIERFTSLPVLGRLPEDRSARSVSGEPAAIRRLRRSSLVTAAATLAARLRPEPTPEPREGQGASAGRHGGPDRRDVRVELRKLRNRLRPHGADDMGVASSDGDVSPDVDGLSSVDSSSPRKDAVGPVR